jgi:hypothetical protein
MRGLFTTTFIAICFAATCATASALPNGAAIAGTAQANDEVRAVVQSKSRIFIGGVFTSVNGKSKHRIASLRASDGKLIRKWRAQANGSVYALQLSRDGSRLYAAGKFTKVNGFDRRHVVALRASSGKVIRSWHPRTDGTVRTLALRKRTLYLGGDFKTVSGKHRFRLAAVSTRTGRPGRWHAFANRAVSALAISGKQLMAGGDFTKVAGQSGKKRTDRPFFASFNAVRKAKIMSFDPGPGFAVRAIKTAKGVVYLGTAGECAPGGNCNAALAYLTATGSQTWRCQTNGDVHSLARAAGVLYVGGHWTALVDGPCSGSARARLMAVNRTTGAVLNWHPGTNGFGMFSLSARSNRLALGGTFTRVTGADHDNFAEFKGNLGATS